jgi:hypothetical protein
MKFPRHILYSNELLIMAWELDQARKVQEDFIAVHDAALEGRRVAHANTRKAKGFPCRSYRRQYLDMPETPPVEPDIRVGQSRV